MTTEIEISGIVAARDRRPYVQILVNGEILAQITIAESRSLAMDLLRAASYAESDAMLSKFFGKMEFPPEALAALLVEFRTFRWELDQEKVDTSHSSPDEQKGPSNA